MIKPKAFYIVLPLMLASSLVLAQAPAAKDPLLTKGKRLFIQCRGCHDIEESKLVKIGPNLKGVLGRQVASVQGFNYSAALKANNFVWDEQQMDAWLKQPTAIAPGTTMGFAGIPDPADRQALVAFLKTVQ